MQSIQMQGSQAGLGSIHMQSSTSGLGSKRSGSLSRQESGASVQSPLQPFKATAAGRDAVDFIALSHDGFNPFVPRDQATAAGRGIVNFTVDILDVATTHKQVAVFIIFEFIMICFDIALNRCQSSSEAKSACSICTPFIFFYSICFMGAAPSSPSRDLPGAS